MKIPAFALVFLLLPCVQCAARTEAEEIVVEIINQKLSTADLSVITPSNREAVMNILHDVATRKVHSIGTANMDSDGAEVILMRLNDADTITRAVTRYRDTYGSRGSFWLAEHFEWAGQASIIPLLAEDFFLEDGNKGVIKNDGGGVGLRVIPRSAFSGITAMRVTIASKQFSDETRAWANQRLIQGYYPFDKFRADMRVWWKQNEAAFKAGNYSAVKPPVPEVHPSLPNPEDSKRVIPSVPIKHSTLDFATQSPAPKPPPVVSNVERTIIESTRWRPWVVGILALIMIVTLVLKRRT